MAQKSQRIIFNIDNPEHINCPECQMNLGKKNKSEFLYKNIAWIFYDTEQKHATVKCRKCEKLRVSIVKYEKLKKQGKLLEFLQQPCPKCNTEGFLYFS